MNRYLGGCVLALLAIATPSHAKNSEIQVLARVADQVVTDRKVLFDLFLERPELYVPGDRRKRVTEPVFEESFQRLITKIMLSEDNRLVGQIQVSNAEVDEKMASLKKAFGANWKAFLADFETSESEIRPAILDSLLLTKSLAARVRAALARGNNETGVESAQTAVEDWLKQLRVRYRVQTFRSTETGSPRGTPKS